MSIYILPCGIASLFVLDLLFPLHAWLATPLPLLFFFLSLTLPPNLILSSIGQSAFLLKQLQQCIFTKGKRIIHRAARVEAPFLCLVLPGPPANQMPLLRFRAGLPSTVHLSERPSWVRSELCFLGDSRSMINYYCRYSL